MSWRRLRKLTKGNSWRLEPTRGQLWGPVRAGPVSAECCGVLRYTIFRAEDATSSFRRRGPPCIASEALGRLPSVLALGHRLASPTASREREREATCGLAIDRLTDIQLVSSTKALANSFRHLALCVQFIRIPQLVRPPLDSRLHRVRSRATHKGAVLWG